jgi:hypothetical protein
MTPTISAICGGLQIDGLPGGPHFVRPPEARMLVLGCQRVDLVRIGDDGAEEDGLALVTDDGQVIVRPGPDDRHGYWSAPLDALKGLVLGLSFAPIDLCPCYGPERATAGQEAGA